MSFPDDSGTYKALLPWLLLLLLSGINNTIAEPEERRTYILHMDQSHKPAPISTDESWHLSILSSLSSSPPDDEGMLLYSYSHVMHGFAARLTTSQLSELEKSPAHQLTQQESFGKLFTTRTTSFLGLKDTSGIWPSAAFGTDVVIGIIDTGIWPESESFGDHGLPAAPQRWKGYCENGTAFSTSSCNRKLIGARSFSKGILAAGMNISKHVDFNSPRDFLGHGTHTSSIAAGNSVLGANYFGYARGTAQGVAPAAHIAMYKVMWSAYSDKSASSDVLAGMDQAIADGVDIMSLSLGFNKKSYFNDAIAIGSLSAVEKGITVVCAAGNDGPHRNSTDNGAPWIMTVGAGTIDRSFVAETTLGNGLKVEGTSYFPQSIRITNASLYYGRGNVSKRLCQTHALDHDEVAGKVVLCDGGSNIDIHHQKDAVKKGGALAGIFLANGLKFRPQGYSIPALVLPTGVGAAVREYARDMDGAIAKVMRFMVTKIGIKPAPQVAAFSSRGPDPISPFVLKPDVLAPGADILGAVIPNRPVMELGRYDLVTDYALHSGTSMATPHVAGVAALIKAVHQDWSPAAIRSAIMTTATTLDNTQKILKDQWNGRSASPLDFGAGHINPNRAMDPGLIYDMDVQNYINFLCGLGYSRKHMRALTRRSQWSCSKISTDLNYPSFVAIFTRGASSLYSKNFSRIVTNVGEKESVYKAIIQTSKGLKIRAEPSTLTFSNKHQKQSFVLNVEIDKDAPNVTYGYLRWAGNHNHIVSSPVVVLFS